MSPEDTPEIMYAETMEDLPSGVSTGVVYEVGEEKRRWIFDGFRWTSESTRLGEMDYFDPTPPVEDTGFKHCSNCVGTRVITTMPPAVKYECETCGGGAELLEMTIPVGAPGPATEQFSDSILVEAERIINGERREHYGHPYVNFGDIAALWSAYVDQPLSRQDVVNMMIMLKLARTKRQGYHRDSYTDVAGYAGCAEKIHEREQTMDNVFGGDTNG